MDVLEWSPMSEAPRDGRGLVARTPGGDVFFYIRWDGGRWMCGPIPIAAQGLTWLSVDDLASADPGPRAP